MLIEWAVIADIAKTVPVRISLIRVVNSGAIVDFTIAIMIIIGTLALGIGANSAIFSVLKTVALEPLPYPDSDELTLIFHGQTSGECCGPLSGQDFVDFRETSTTYEYLAGLSPVRKPSAPAISRMRSTVARTRVAVSVFVSHIGFSMAIMCARSISPTTTLPMAG